MEGRFLETGDGVKLHYAFKKGEKQPLVFLHGVGSNHSVWKLFCAAFHDHTCLAIDLRSHGKSAKGSSDFNLYVNDVEQILIQENIQNPVLVGNSLGAVIAKQYAERFPSKVDKLVLISIYAKEFARLPVLLRPFIWSLHRCSKIVPYNRSLEFQDYSEAKSMADFPRLDVKGTSVKKILEGLNKLFSTKFETSNINHPTLVVQGTKDIIVKVRKLRKHCERNNNVIFKPVKCNHHVTTHKPEEVIQAMRQFL